MPSELYIGVISGTSMDALDAVIIEVADNSFRTTAHHSRQISSDLRKLLLQLCTPGENEIQLSGEADVKLGHEISTTINELIEKEGLSRKDIKAIGSHGQTIRHSVDGQNPFTLQIGNPNIIAEQTGITTIADFRMADIAAGGQGAPLACLLHEEVFRSDVETRIVLNLGGIANITILAPSQITSGYDTGPANTLMDQWIFHCKSQSYDRDGEWASTGKIIEPLLAALMKDPYISLEAPKSTGREHFNLDWLEQFISGKSYQQESIQRTLLEYSAITISDAIKSSVNRPCTILLCGGGVFNTNLIARLQELLPDFTLRKTDDLDIHSQQVEAAAFALLAHKTMQHLPGNLPRVTGARKPKVLGGVYFSS